MKVNLIIKSLLLCLIVVAIASCDKNYSEIGTDLVGADHFGTTQATYGVNAYKQATGPVQTSDLAVNSLGIYQNPIFGKAKANFLTQVSLSVANQTIYNTTEVTPITMDSVYIYVPFYSTLEDTDSSTGNSTYTLDSIFPASDYESRKIKLTLYRSGTNLDAFDTQQNLQQQKIYYSNDKPAIEAEKLEEIKWQDQTANNIYSFKDDQILFYKGNPATTDVETRFAPGIFILLDNNYFKNLIVNANNAGALYNNGDFKNYFKGLYFDVDDVASSQGVMARLNFAAGRIAMNYRVPTSPTDATLVRKNITWNLTGRTVNLFDDQLITPLTTGNTTTGDDELVVKGGEGSLAIIDLFNGDVNANNSTLNTMRTEGWLINDAQLSFTTKPNALNTSTTKLEEYEPQRLYLYNFTDSRVLVDYTYDFSTSTTNTKNNKYIYGGIGKKNSSDKTTTYTFNITNHLRTLVKYKDSTNVKLGLVTTENINNAVNCYYKTPFATIGTRTIKYLPSMSVVNPLGTILYGSTSSVPEDKRVQLKIWYTKPD